LHLDLLFIKRYFANLHDFLFVQLVEPSLKHVWEGDSGCLSASMAALIVGHAEDMNGAAYLQHFAKILASLRDLNSANCDAGVAYAVTNASSISDDNAKETSVKSIRALLSAAGIYDQGQLEANKKRSNKDRSGAINDFDLMLPPRVALEHPNAQLRLDAIAKLTTEAKDNDDSDDIAVALLRRYCSDDNLSVVSASVNALVEMGVDGSLSELFLLQNDTANDVINGFKRALKAAGISAKWENNERISIGDDESRMVCSALKLSGMVAKILKDNLDFELVDLEDDHTSENIYDNYERLVQGIVNIQYHCETDEDINFSAIENDAADALDSALNAGTKKAKSKATLMKDIVKGAAFQKVLQRSICSLTSDENVGVLETERLVWFFLHHTDSIPGKDCDADLIEYIIDACLLILERYEKETEKTEEFTSNATILTSNLAKCVSFLLSGGNVHEISKLVSDLSTIRSKVAYEEVGVKILETMSKSNPDLYPYLLFEILSRPNLAIIGIKRTLAAVDSFITTLGREDRNSVCRGLLVCAIALCCNSNLAVRETALDMIAKMAKMLGDNDAVATAFACICSTGCAPQSSMRSNMMMDGSSALPKMLSAAVQEGEDDSILRTLLLETCADLVNKMLHDNTNFAGEGICHSVVILLNAMEFAGEKSFSLNDRWHLAGKPIFDHFLAFPPSQSSASLQSLIECMLVMLKGITVEGDAAEDSIVISTGPAVSGRRRRAYSVGTSHGIAFIDPYPDEMQNTLTLFLSLAVKKPDDPFVLQLCEAVNRLVLSRSSWAKGIFTKLDNKTRDMITKSLLALRSDGGIESAGLALLGLPLTAEQFAEAISSKSSRASKADSGGLLALTALMDCIRAQAKSLESGKGVMKLLSVLYGKLSSLSNEDFAHDGSDYARTCVINALLALSENANDATQITKKTSGNKLPKEIGSQSKLLVSLLGEGGGGVKPLVSSRSRSLCLQLLTRLCALSPTSVVDSLIPAMINAISIDGARSSVTRDALVAIVPAYCTHAPSAGFSLLTLLHAFVKKCEEDSVSFEKKVQLYSYLNDALMSSSDNGSAGEVTSTVVTTYIASEAAPNHRIVVDDDNSPLSFVQELLSNIDANIQIAATLQILQYVGKLLPYLQNNGNHAMEDNSSFFILEIADICNLATNGPLKPESLKVKMPYQQKEKLPIMWCVTTLLSVVKQIYATGVVKRVIRDGDDSQARICLNIWQELMTLQSASTHARYEEASEGKTHSASDKFWESLGDETSGILSSLQNLLPAPHFLASVSSLISDNDVEVDIQRRALLLLAERCIETDPTSHEAVLFLEMLPDLVNLTGAKAKKADDFDFDSYRHSSILSQSSFKAIDQLSKSLGITVLDEKLRRKRTKAFMPALQATASYLHRIASNFEIPDFNNLNEANISAFNLETQVMSSAALCAASLITLLKAKCLTMLPKLVKPLIKLLTVANAHVTECNNKEIVNDSTGQSVKLIQLSALRALVAVADHIPQFLTPYIAGLMTVNGLPSQCLRGTESEEEIAVNNMADRLDRSIASGAAARQLIPILSKATSICLKSSSQGERIWKESLVIFKILKLSIEKATRSDLGPMAGKIISSLVQAYAFDCDIPTRIELINVANDTLLAMVMKLSEAQLRPLYTKLREWRGDLDTSQADGAAARRRNAFWSLSAAMSKELRSIFLPCMSTVVGDIVKELVSHSSPISFNHNYLLKYYLIQFSHLSQEFAVSCLCITKSSKGNKRQKLSETKSNVSDLTRPLQSLLLCIESSLNADAHEGGNWIRGDDGQRYTSILQPLMKLLSATVPQDCNILPMTVESNRPSSAYERLVQGVTTEDHGNISSCITSLAAAAGNEQMWKPLNHSLLEACADEKRPEVRKSGVKTLLSIIHALGEEYMVLLPECLPVLSELLEDEDEDIVALSKECVQQGEELLGESLEDNLR
jgi:hypothetical protein